MISEAGSFTESTTLAERLEDLISKREWLILLGMTVVYLAGTIAACQRAFWYDEYVTLDMINFSTPTKVLAALAEGGDLTPPLYPLVNWSVTQLVGASHVGMRLVSVVGFWVACCCLFLFVKKCWGVIPAFIALLVLTLTIAESFASEARSYGVSLGFAGIALVSWQHATTLPKRRNAAMAFFAVSVFLLVATHFLNLFMLVPFGIVELYRRFKNNKTDWAVWLSLVGGVAPIFIFSYFAGNVIRYAASVWKEGVPSLAAPYPYYADLLEPLVVPLIAVGAMLAIGGLWKPSGKAVRSEETIRPQEILLTTGFLLIPLLVVFTCHFRHTFCSPRYGLGATIGVALLMAGFAWRVTHFYRSSGLIIFLVLLACFLRLEVLHVLTTVPARADSGLTSLGPVVPGELPILINDPHSFMRVLHDWPAGQRKRVRYAYDFDFAKQYIGKTMLDRHLALYANRHPGAILPYQDFAKSADRFLLYYSPGYDNHGWLIKFLVDKRARVEALGSVGQDMVFLVADSSGTKIPKRN